MNMREDGLDLRGVPRTRFYCVGTSPCKFFEWGLRGADLRESVRLCSLSHGVDVGVFRKHSWSISSLN